MEGGRRIRAGGGAADDDPALARAEASDLAPRRLADMLDDDVGPGSRQLAHAGGDVVAVVVERLVGAELARKLELARRSRR